MINHATTPQPFSSPLNLMYKGAFSTKVSSKTHNQYGHYLDKLYHIEFLGIGEHEGSILHGIINASVLGHTSIGDSVTWYRASPDRYRESLELKGMGAVPVTGAAGGNQFTNLIQSLRLDEVSPADLLKGKSFGKLLMGVEHGLHLMTEIKVGSVSHEILLKRLDELKESGLLNVVDLRKVVYRGDLIDLSTLRKDEHRRAQVAEYTDYDRVNVRAAEKVVDIMADGMGIKQGTLLLSDKDTLARLVKVANIVVEALSAVESGGRQAIQETAVEFKLTPRESSIVHYLLLDNDEQYKEAVLEAVSDYAGKGENQSLVLDSLQFMTRDILKDFVEDETYELAYKVLKSLTDSDESVGEVVRKVRQYVQETVGEKVKEPAPAKIDFEHNVEAEDSKGYLSLLNMLYEDFVNFNNVGDILELPTSGTNTVGKETLIVDYLLSNQRPDTRTEVSTYRDLGEAIIREYSVMDDEHAELWNDIVTVTTYSGDEDLFGEIVETDTKHVPDIYSEVFAELVTQDETLTESLHTEIFGELTDSDQVVSPYDEEDLWGELTSSDDPVTVVGTDMELWGEMTSEQEPYQYEHRLDITGVRVTGDEEGHVNKEYEIAVLGGTDPDLKYRRRPPLKPDPEPPEPLFEWVCTEGYVCDDWLIVPLKDFNFENPDQEGFFDPETWEPYYPTGKTDEDGNPYVLPPYSVLNEPISNGADVGGKEPMSIDPCNLYSFIEYAVKIYDAYKTRFQVSNPIDTISRVMNLLFEQTQKLVDEWDETKHYTPDELWRIYRFIRWMALGVTHRFYRVKVDYSYGDFIEHFEVFPFSPLIKTEGAYRKHVQGYGFVLEGHPLTEDVENTATFEFELPKKTRSSTISFDMGHVVPDRPDDIVPAGVLFREDFEGDPQGFRLNGPGWVPVESQSGTGLGIEDPARVRTYSTNTFNVPTNAVNPTVVFNYHIDTNMESRILLKRTDGTIVWRSAGVVDYGTATVNPIGPGNYYFEIRVPQAESSNTSNILFTAQQIQDEWQKVGYQTEWRVDGNVIYEEENTPSEAMVINPQWIRDSDYELEVEFKTEDVQSNYGLIDWIGVVLNYKDPQNYYLFGTWSHLDPISQGGLSKVVNGVRYGDPNIPWWKINPDFRYELGKWHKLRAVVKGNRFTIYIDNRKYLDIVDTYGWGHGSCGLAVYSNPLSSFRNFRYRGKPRFHAYIDNVTVQAPHLSIPVYKPKYTIDFYLDSDTSPRIRDYSDETKRTYSFPILEGEHSAKWVFKKRGQERSVSQDASFIDNIVVKGMRIVDAEVREEFIGCGGHFAVKLLIENLLEYYRRHHQGCKGSRDIWIVE